MKNESDDTPIGPHRLWTWTSRWRSGGAAYFDTSTVDAGSDVVHQCLVPRFDDTFRHEGSSYKGRLEKGETQYGFSRFNY